MTGLSLPESLSTKPNIPWEEQTLEQLRAERDYWEQCVAEAPGFASAKAADDFRQACEAWIVRRAASEAEAPAQGSEGR